MVLSISAPVGALDAISAKNEKKMDSALKENLKTMSDTDTVMVSVWFDDIDYDIVKTNVEEKLNGNSHSIEVSEKAIDLAFCDVENTVVNNEMTLAVLSNIYADVTNEEIKAVIEAERTVVSKMYQEHNQNIINSLLAETSQTISAKKASEGGLSSRIDYICRYAPNADMTLTKEQIMTIAKSDSVTEINYIDSSTDLSLNTVELNGGYDEEDEPYDMTFFNVTGLATARDAWGLDGSDINVGMVEGVAFPKNVDSINTIERVYPSGIMSDGYHASLVASIMVTSRYETDGTVMFKGAIPNARLFAAVADDERFIKPAVEALLDVKVTAINCSFSYPYDPPTYNVYGDIAKWYDHISVQHNVHLILSASNNGALGVRSSNNSYNAIVVGACDNNGNILSDSSYVITSNYMNKPDLVAPGSEIRAPIYSDSGTSFAAPMVTSAVVQLSQASPILLSNPTLMKALLMSSSVITSAMSSDADVNSVINGTDSAISQKYGAGMLNVTKAYSAFVDNGYYKTGTMSPYSEGIRHTKNLSRAVGKTVRVCLTWNKMNTVSDPHDSATATSLTLDNFMLTVTTPSGVVYSSQNLYDNKQMISFVATESGTYTFDVSRFGTGTSGQIVKYSFVCSVQS